MVILRIIITYFASGEQSWVSFGVKSQARFREISGDLDETILTPPKCLASEDQCLSLVPIKSGIELEWNVRYRIYTLRGEKGSGRIRYSGIRCGGLPPGTRMHGKKDQALWRQAPSIRQMKKGV